MYCYSILCLYLFLCISERQKCQYSYYSSMSLLICEYTITSETSGCSNRSAGHRVNWRTKTHNVDSAVARSCHCKVQRGNGANGWVRLVNAGSWRICYDTCWLQGPRICVEVTFIGNRMEGTVPTVSTGRSNTCLLSTDSYRPPVSFRSMKGLPQLCCTGAGRLGCWPCFLSATHEHVIWRSP
jgi:hypothetical protein